MGRWRGKRWGGEVRGGGPAVVGRRLRKGWWEGGCGRGRGDVRDQRAHSATWLAGVYIRGLKFEV